MSRQASRKTTTIIALTAPSLAARVAKLTITSMATSVRSAQLVLFATVSSKHSAHQVKLVARHVVLLPKTKHVTLALAVNTVLALVQNQRTAVQALTTTKRVPRHQIPAKLVDLTFTVSKKEQRSSPSASRVVKMKTAKISAQELTTRLIASENVPRKFHLVPVYRDARTLSAKIAPKDTMAMDAESPASSAHLDISKTSQPRNRASRAHTPFVACPQVPRQIHQTFRRVSP